MSRSGPPPNPDRIRRNTDPRPAVCASVAPADKPELPGSVHWPEATVAWWGMLDDHPLRPGFTGTDWAFLLSTALIHAAFWEGDMKVASELRLRESKYAFTPEDRMRLRLQITAPSEAKPEPTKTPASAAGRKDRLLKAVQ